MRPRLGEAFRCGDVLRWLLIAGMAAALAGCAAPKTRYLTCEAAESGAIPRNVATEVYVVFSPYESLNDAKTADASVSPAVTRWAMLHLLHQGAKVEDWQLVIAKNPGSVTGCSAERIQKGYLETRDNTTLQLQDVIFVWGTTLTDADRLYVQHHAYVVPNLREFRSAGFIPGERRTLSTGGGKVDFAIALQPFAVDLEPSLFPRDKIRSIAALSRLELRDTPDQDQPRGAPRHADLLTDRVEITGVDRDRWLRLKVIGSETQRSAGDFGETREGWVRVPDDMDSVRSTLAETRFLSGVFYYLNSFHPKLGISKSRLARMAQAELKTFSDATKGRPAAQALLMRAHLLIEHEGDKPERLREAEELARRAISEAPDLADAWHLQALARVLVSQDSEVAAAYAQQIMYGMAKAKTLAPANKLIDANMRAYVAYMELRFGKTSPQAVAAQSVLNAMTRL